MNVTTTGARHPLPDCLPEYRARCIMRAASNIIAARFSSGAIPKSDKGNSEESG